MEFFSQKYYFIESKSLKAPFKKKKKKTQNISKKNIKLMTTAVLINNFQTKYY